MRSVADVVGYLRQFAPLELAADWDNVGLLLGDRDQPVTRMLTCLTITPEVVAESVDTSVSMIVSHHPILFKGAKKLSSDTPEGRLLLPLMRAGVAVYSPHTAFDNAPDGINTQLATQLGAVDLTPLRLKEGARQSKIVVFVPESDLAPVSDALFAAGAGQIGEYRECSFRTAGTGTFFGSAASNPTIGQAGRREEVSEWRLEAICPEGKIDAAIAAIRAAHSYEEPAFDVYPLRPNRTTGEGRVGRLPKATTLQKLAQKVKKELRAGAVQLIGEPTRPVTRVAVACGAAGEFLTDAIRAKADVFLTGEMRFHDYLTAQSAGIGVLVCGHYPTERPAVEALAIRLAAAFPEIPVTASQRETDPVHWV
ncbi:Nif3-like dinuclear metal center hexameric protein [Tuwongella immobilis]|uniref:GTP cyclohydrolase 1 type 2 homolog n=1 Tax=Tuwongella immobilis TaxID=692036 RepID=A0A6C2YSM3_9BACT|nr:Nif3-like dinuclear metal center hexameric protein [Tuwongella immobilis]VIP04143.1 dinuclear metal center sa1388 family : Putative GTP cyclohydrolase 1 type 2 OS=Isosphaera pallida (strain ATCC 43644 / DSM 9630 / IS1B) GN=Isop_2843 PE=3 SV=1: NIF3 [Tuwongella immobilis]VTS05651.1 dinuclear metal center sa1388 family : Putative GTP cyclohydrolase 1 type 2 OS=Isosphaera pallida (strain ATCC 43644 / DSM 9630 / IS1B) GN=Isop_2843 PE=3 SV=1: NIF3 [Tuwongella immobilis]